MPSIPTIADLSSVCAAYSVSDAESLGTARELLRAEGILGGSSTGTLLAAALRYCREQKTPKRVVSFVVDTGTRYLSKMYNDQWMLDQGLLPRKRYGDLRDVISRRFEEGAGGRMGGEELLEGRGRGDGGSAGRQGHHQLAEQFRKRPAPDGISIAAGFLRQRLRQPRLADPRRAGEQDRVMLSDPLRVHQGAHQGTIQPAGMAEIDILHTGFAIQLGSLQPARHGLVFPPRPVLVHQQTEALVETQRGDFRILHLLAPGLGQSEPAQSMQSVQRLLIHHSGASSNREAA